MTLKLENLLKIIEANRLECNHLYAQQIQQQHHLEADQKGLRIDVDNLKNDTLNVNKFLCPKLTVFKLVILGSQIKDYCHDSKSVKETLLRSAKKFSGHGISHIALARSNFARASWLIVICFSFAFCCYYIINSFTDFFAYDIISNIRVINDQEITFPAVIFCGWYSGFAIDTAVFQCQFQQKDCQEYGINFEKIIVLGYGASYRHYCIRFNGKNNTANRENEKLMLVNRADSLYYGLSVGFLLPNEVNQFLIFSGQVT